MKLSLRRYTNFDHIKGVSFAGAGQQQQQQEECSSSVVVAAAAAAVIVVVVVAVVVVVVVVVLVLVLILIVVVVVVVVGVVQRQHCIRNHWFKKLSPSATAHRNLCWKYRANRSLEIEGTLTSRETVSQFSLFL